MIKHSVFAVAALGLFAAGAFAQQDEALQTRQTMVDEINPAALAIWDVTNAAMNDEGGLDPALISEDDWGKLAESGQALDTVGRRMAAARTIVAAGPNLVAGAVPPGAASREQIQAMIDADPDGFRAVAVEMAKQGAALAAAAKARDAAAVGDLSTGLDGACSSCHTRYWYLQEPPTG